MLANSADLQIFRDIAAKAQSLVSERDRKYSIETDCDSFHQSHYLDDFDSFADYAKAISTPIQIYANAVHSQESPCIKDAENLIIDFSAKPNFRSCPQNHSLIQDLNQELRPEDKDHIPLGGMLSILKKILPDLNPNYRQAALAYIIMRVAKAAGKLDLNRIAREQIYQPLVDFLNDLILEDPTTDNLEACCKKINDYFRNRLQKLHQKSSDWWGVVNEYNLGEFPVWIGDRARELSTNIGLVFSNLEIDFNSERLGYLDNMRRFHYEKSQALKQTLEELRGLFAAKIKNLGFAKTMSDEFAKPLKEYLVQLADQYFPKPGDAQRIYDSFDLHKVLNDTQILARFKAHFH